MRRRAFAAQVWSKLVGFEKKERLLERGDRVLAAVSGGPDSVCLAHYLAARAKREGFSLFLIHFHHGLRGRAADADARFVLKLGQTLGVPTTAQRLPVKALAAERGLGLEEAGRKLRYKALASRARRLKCGKVATGHQLDDQAETVLLHLLRGTSLCGVGGIPPRRPLAPGVELIRPLLPLTREDVRAYLTVHGLKSREDKSNKDPKFTRNWVRKEVIPLLESRVPGVKRRLAEIASAVRDSEARGA